MVGTFHAGLRSSLAAKGAGAVGLVALADLLFFRQPLGFTVGAFALAFAAALAAVQPAVLRDRRALLFLLGALVMALGMIERPTFAGWLVFGVCIGIAGLSPRAGPHDDAWRWFQRLAWQPMVGSIGPVLDALKLMDKRLNRARFAPLRLLPVLVVPVLGGLLFLGLFAAANPVIADALSHLRPPAFDLGRLFFWGVVFVVVWHVLRPRHLRRPIPTPGGRGDRDIPGVSLLSVTLSLMIFNALFALQNGLDIAFLWSGARLPEQFTLAEYVHAGVYPLIFSALCTGLFVLIALRPGSRIAASRPVRALLVAWVAQNLFVVASSAYRMWLYVESFSLTRLRILVLLWMALIAVGLVSLLWRVLRDRGTGWLLNLNAGAGLLALVGLSVVDIGAVVAEWNLTHARDAGGRGVAVDLCYLQRLGPSALVPLARFERRGPPAALARQTASVRALAYIRARDQLKDWRGWSWRAQRRLDTARALGATAVGYGDGWCGGD
ncbi:MAG: DUF4173 domain-containing protein [Caulobacteraceae bacterium]|nr:DUF4173 domain-containing protein [Caulobacteraceae bacterium]